MTTANEMLEWAKAKGDNDRTHSAECWKWHPQCAIIRYAALLDEVKKANVPRCQYCYSAPCECALREAGRTGYES